MTGTPRLYGLLADATVLLHAVFVLFVVLGQGLIVAGWLRGWRWTRHPALRYAHLGAICLVAAQAWLGITCPLTSLENFLRSLAGDAPYPHSFVGFWVDRWLFYDAPPWVFVALYSAFLLVVLVTFTAYPPRGRRRSDRA